MEIWVHILIVSWDVLTIRKPQKMKVNILVIWLADWLDTRSDILSIEKTPDINDFETDNVRIDDLQEVIVHNEILLLEGIHYNLFVYTPYSVIQVYCLIPFF